MVCKISNYFPIIQSHWAVKIPNVLILHQYRWNTVPNRPFLSLMPNGTRKWAMSDTMAYRWLLKYGISFPLFIVVELYKFQIFHWYRWNSPKRPWWSLETLKTWNSLPGFSVMIFCPVHVFLWHMESCLEDRVESVCFSLWGSPSVKDVFEVLKFLKSEFTSEWPRQQNVGHGPFLSPKATGKIFLIV